MMAKSSTSLDMERAELQAVLESELFTRAPTLAHLLSYLCEKSFSGESSSIKEYSVGIDVFHRGPDFEQESDSIVRVQANRLRKRLAEYYADKGAGHELRITIPIGQYVPVFESARHAPEAVTPAAKPPLPANGLARVREMLRTKGAVWALWAGVVVLLLAAVALVFWNVRRPKPGHPATATVSQAAQQPPGWWVAPWAMNFAILGPTGQPQLA
jgi:hypothetical protein